MVLIKEIELELTKQNGNAPEAIEDTLIKDSVIDLANADFSKVDDIEDVAVGEIRKKVIVDTGYSGKPITRKKFHKSDFQGDICARKKVNSDGRDYIVEEDSSEDSDFDFNENKSGSDNESSEFGSEDPSDVPEEELSDREPDENISEDDDEDDEDDNEEEEEFGDEIDLSRYNEAKESQNEGFIDIFSAKTKDTDSEVAKGICVKNQLTIWESLLEGRIKLQPSLISANKLYQKDDFLRFKSKLKPEDETVLSNTCSSLGKLMKTLLELQEVLLNSSKEYFELRDNKDLSNEMKHEEVSDDESISSSIASGKDDDDEDEEEEEEENGNVSVSKSNNDEPKNKKIKLGNYSDHLQELYLDFKPFKDKTIQLWNDKTRITSGKMSSSDFSAFDQPTLKQIEQILLDKSRLVKKTQLKRSDYEILGKQQKPAIQPEDDDVIVKDNERTQKEYDEEIFDDDDFYHKLLRDLIARKSTDVTDTRKHGRQWLEIQHLRSKMKRKVDTRCTKGRKLRYTVHNKLVNFMAPISCNMWSEEAESQLFKSLFGKATEQLS